ncbi:flavodoxin family protein [Corallincola holothuriorum]|uniref:Flavodoxin family protein n=1 Tax=Corallincola holothuriorum TaxID=2282215 RepID=A0A368NHN1_9GAMM|nr:NAD(P)H-dependent oxidoreductase [Corallincola holothuriorum]RCU49245.1 flavodoxin family protein [Corallincola holothuriorum]
MKRKILLLFAHPSQHRSEVNLPLYKAAKKIDGVTCVDLYREYPDYCINIDREQKRLLSHDIVIFMFPLYWYSTPAILKEWQDLVLEYGFAYGQGGDALQGKWFLNALTAGGSEQAYKAEGYNHFRLDELLQPLQQMADACGMRYLPPFALFGSRTAAAEQRLKQHVDAWQRLLLAMTEGRFDIEKGCKMRSLTEQIDQLISEAI